MDIKVKVITALLVAICARSAIFGASIADALAIFSISALCGFTMYLKNKEQESVNDVVKRDITELKSAVGAIRLGKSYGKPV